MNMSSTTLRRGSALITVLLFTFALLLLVSSILSWSLTERRMNTRNALWIEARNAAETAAQYGLAQVRTIFESQASPPSFRSGRNNGTRAEARRAGPRRPGGLFAGSSVDPSALRSSAEPSGGYPGVGEKIYIDGNNMSYGLEKFKNTYVYRRDIQIIAKATARAPNSEPITAYVTQTASVIGSPFFGNAILYSANDLEIFPGPNMYVYGPVHVNGNLFVSSQGNSLNFYGPVTASGAVYHSWANQKPAGQGTGGTQGEALNDTNNVNFINASGHLVSMLSSNVWKDSTMGAAASLYSNGRFTDTNTPALDQLRPLITSDFATYADLTWNGNVRTGDMGVGSYNPIGTGNKVGVDAAGQDILANTPDADAIGYGPHSMIDPPDTTLTPSDPYFDAKTPVEQQKFASKTGLYVRVTVQPGQIVGGVLQNDAAVVEVFGWPGSAEAAGVTDHSDPRYGPNGGIKLGTVPAGLLSFVPYNATATAATSATTTVTSYTHTTPGVTTSKNRSTGKYSYTYSSATVRKTTQTNSTTQNGTVTFNGSGGSTFTNAGGPSSSNGTPSTTTVATVPAVTSASSYANSAAAQTAGETARDAAINARMDAYTDSTTTSDPNTTIDTAHALVNSGLYDQRQQAGVDLVQLDLSVLRDALKVAAGTLSDPNKAIKDASGSVWGSGTTGGGYNPDATGTSGWNGGIYVEVKNPTNDLTQTSVAIANGKVSSGNSLTPALNDAHGLTVATNAPVYTLGNTNADGNNAGVTGVNGSGTLPDDSHNGSPSSPSAEIPMAIAADAITILSPGYFGSQGTNGSIAPTTNSSTTNAGKSWSTANPTATGDAEVASAFITGLVATTDIASSGGVHNLPRFLENFSGKTVAIRGSLVSMYSSKIATGVWSTGYYSPPTRNWGFNQLFKNGNYPPLTPVNTEVNRINYQDISAAKYTSLRESFSY